MEHIGELFTAGRHAYLIPNDAPAEGRLEGYVRALSRLVESAELRDAMAHENRRLASAGPFSLEQRNRRLLGVYSAAIAAHRSGGGQGGLRPQGELMRSHGLAHKELPEEYLWLELGARISGRNFRLLF